MFKNIQVCVFDAYGTLFDVHSAAGFHSKALGKLESPVSELWRAKQLQYTWLRSLMGNYVEFWTVTGDALDYALETHGVQDPELRNNLMDSYLNLQCFDEVPDVLRLLKKSGKSTAILSNGSPYMLNPVVKNSGISEYLDACISVDEIGIYKPVPKVYDLACKRFGVKPEEICFLSSNCWDAIGAASFGFQVAWVNRYNQQLDRMSVEPQAEIKDLTDLPALLGIA